MSVRLVIGAASDVGRVRDHNEDAYLVDDELGLVAVADGMGGHQAGEVASVTALAALRAAVVAAHDLHDAIVAANVAVFTQSSTDQALHGMGTTLTVGTLTDDDTIVVGQVGDSRAYLVHDGELRRITTDHSVIEELIQAGELTEEEAERDPRRSMITRALGLGADVEVDVYPVPLVAGDRLLLCSDGLTGMVREPRLAEVLHDETDATRAAERLVELANEAGGVDNITVVVVDVVVDAMDTDESADPLALLDAGAPTPKTSDDAPTLAVPAVAPSTRRRRGWRLARWALLILVIVGVAFGSVAWYAESRYFVSSDLGLVSVYHGVPGGLLVFDPTVERRTDLEMGDLTSSQRSAVRDGKEFSSREDADAYADRLCRRARSRDLVKCRTSKQRRPAISTTTTTAPTTTPTPRTGPTTPDPSTLAPTTPAPTVSPPPPPVT